VSIEAEFRQVLAELELLSHGRTQSFNSSGRGKSTAVLPFGESAPAHLHWRLEWERDPSRRTLEAARAELEAWRVRQAPAETDGSTWEDWVIRDGEGYAVAQVAQKFTIAEARVRRIRLKYGRDSEYGMAETEVPRDDSRERILNLAARGCTLRQIEMQTGKNRETVRRWLRKAA
jgi:hypothetical protein